MKIAILSSGLGHVARGIETWADSLATELYKRGLDVTLFKGGGKATRPFERVIPCLQYNSPTAITMCKFTRHFFWRYGLGSTWRIQEITFGISMLPILIRERFQIVHLQDPRLALLLERTCKLHKAKVILGHGTEENFDFLLNFRYLQELAPYYLEEDRKRGIPKGKTWFAVPNFVDCEKFKPGDREQARQKLNIPVDKFVILDVAAVKVAHKRIDYLINEARLLKERQPNIFLLIAGASTQDTPKLERLAGEHLGESVRFLLDKPSDEMSDVYRAADIFVHSALFEMMSISLLESLASGVPVIANKHPVFDWVIGDGGQTADIQKNGALAALMETYVDDPALRLQKSLAARQRAVSIFSAPKVTDEVMAMYEKVLLKNEK